ncbi:MAG: LysM domain-containing protein [Thermodesulfobacteriota bacterium]
MNGNRIMMAITCFFVSCTMALVLAPGCLAQEGEETVEHEAGFYYTIQKGDTLWDLSDHFFDSPWLWPELWQENDQIPNPHRIYPGERIRLYQKEGSDTFSLTPPEKESMVEESAAETEMPEETVQEETVYFLYPSMDKVGFITKDEITPLATIFDIKDNQRLVDTGDTVYMSYEEEDVDKLQRGSQFTIYRRMEPSPDKKINRKYGSQYYIVGMVELTKMEPDFVVGQIVASYRSIYHNDFILPYARRSPRIPVVPSTPDIDGTVLLAEEHTKMIGDHTVAFIDKGSEDNILPGQRYSIYHRQEGKKGSKRILYSPIDYAEFIVLHTEKYVSTVFMTYTEGVVEPGGKFRTPVE